MPYRSGNNGNADIVGIGHIVVKRQLNEPRPFIEEGFQLLENCRQLKLKANEGKNE